LRLSVARGDINGAFGMAMEFGRRFLLERRRKGGT
jgi:hypothetical protein